MQDIEIARRRLGEKGLSLAVVKNGEILFESRSSGISGLLESVNILKEGLWGSSVADRIVGRAAALLLVYSHVECVYAVTLSNEGLRLLEENHIQFEYSYLVPRILDKTGKDICPFEKISLSIRSPEESYEQLRQCAENLKKK